MVGIKIWKSKSSQIIWKYIVDEKLESTFAFHVPFLRYKLYLLQINTEIRSIGLSAFRMSSSLR